MPSFELFIGAWNDRLGLDTPPVHQRMARWLARSSHLPDMRLLLMAFRGCGKSTLLGLYCCWRLLHQPDLRILVVAADESLAENMLRHARGILEAHPLLRPLIPAQKTDWAADRLTIRRPHVGRDPSLRAAGIHSNITGARADLIICDDVEVMKTADTSSKREALRQRLHELEFILTPGGGIIYLGTPHTEESLYKANGFLHNYQRLEVPLTPQCWPQRFSGKTIDAIRLAVGPRVFAAQMLLQPTQLYEARLDPDLINLYDEDVPFKTARCYWDPAFAGQEGKGDRSVVALVLLDLEQNICIHDVLYLPPAPAGEEESAFQCRMMATFLQRHHLHHIAVEGNGLGRFLPGLLRQHLQNIGYKCAVQLVHQSQNKNQRLLHAFEARLHANAIHAHKSVTRTPLFNEMRAWQAERNDNDDDGMDAVAGAIALLPQQANLLPSRTFHILNTTD